jgi:hypothetical protein
MGTVARARKEEKYLFVSSCSKTGVFLSSLHYTRMPPAFTDELRQRVAVITDRGERESADILPRWDHVASLLVAVLD